MGPTKPFQDADRNTHETVLAILRDHPAGTLFDAPAGEGALAEALAEAEDGTRKRVFSGDRNPVRTSKIGREVVVVDLNKPLPIRSAALEYFTCIEGIEHLTDPFLFVEEVQRVLKPGGLFIITTPNILNIRSRWRFLFSGFYNKFRRPLDEDSRSLALHINPISYWQLRYMLARAGFSIRRVTTNRIKAVDWMMAPFIPLVALGTYLILHGEKAPAQRVRNREVRRHLLSPAVLLGQALIVEAKKT